MSAMAMGYQYEQEKWYLDWKYPMRERTLMRYMSRTALIVYRVSPVIKLITST